MYPERDCYNSACPLWGSREPGRLLRVRTGAGSLVLRAKSNILVAPPPAAPFPLRHSRALSSRTFCDDGRVLGLPLPYGSHQPHVASEHLPCGQGN